MLFDYETLRVIWWLLLGVLLIGFAVMDGFDMGVAMLLQLMTESDTERRILINSVGPVWEGNQVWFILGGGAIFAAWPPLYATAFSGFYIAMFLILAALILRPVGFKFRSKLEEPRWRATWDWALFIGGAVPALIFGVAVGNVLQGVPFHFNEDLLPVYEGGFFGLLNPFALLCGLLSVSLLLTQGAAYLAIKTEAPLRDRAARWVLRGGAVSTLLFALGGVWLALGIAGYAISGEIDVNGPSNPLVKQVVQEDGAWLRNYGAQPWTLLAPLLGFAGLLGAMVLALLRRPMSAFIASSVAIFGVISTVGLSMFPFILPSSTEPGSSITVWDGSSSHLTLQVMLIATAIFMPIVIAYTSWVFRVLRGPVTEESVSGNDQAY
ncbi:MAG: cytochrome d ubiquinol oxidase subunit II [Rhodovibrionaceae bacterium]